MPAKSYTVRFDKPFAKQLKKLSPLIQSRILKFIKENLINTNNPRIHGKALTGNYKGFWRYRIGNYRLIADIRGKELIIILIKIAHRGDVYGK